MAYLPRKDKLFAAAFALFALVADQLNFDPLIVGAVALVSVVVFSTALWKWAGEFKHQTSKRRVLLGLQVYVSGLFVLSALLAIALYYVAGNPRGMSVEQWESEIGRLQRVSSQRFLNTDVELDGKDFQNSEFISTTLVFRATHPFGFANSHFQSPVVFKVANGPAFTAARHTWELMRLACASMVPAAQCPTQKVLVEPLQPDKTNLAIKP